jgi:hypothetical protein
MSFFIHKAFSKSLSWSFTFILDHYISIVTPEVQMCEYKWIDGKRKRKEKKTWEQSQS